MSNDEPDLAYEHVISRNQVDGRVRKTSEARQPLRFLKLRPSMQVHHPEH